jgi:hypothetical protein
MPFLSRLLRRKGYRLRTLYSGLPSATPAVQGELFYGVRTAVPSFCFRDHVDGQFMRMFDPGPAAKVQAWLGEKGPGLLTGGSAYCDIFSGGAAEAHVCPSEFGWGSLWKAVHPLRFTVFILLYIDSVIRVSLAMILEFILAIIDCARGLIQRRHLWKELGMVPSRVAVGILLREMITIGATVDAARGLPAIHVNFLGYDEQAHRRGPASAFAHWSLRGIDRAVRIIWRAARRSRRRHYQVWIYSDHGQVPTLDYQHAMGKTIQRAVEEVFRVPADALADSESSSPHHGIQYHRSKWAGDDVLPKMLRVHARVPQPETPIPTGEVLVTAMGSLGQIYCPPFASDARRDEIARGLIARAGVPLVLAADGDGQALAWNAEGCFHLPADAPCVFGPDYPFLETATEDLVALCHHPDAGALVLCGWSRLGNSVSFSHESGAHAGPSVDETRAFLVLPDGVRLPRASGRAARPLDLRAAALAVLGRTD